MNQKTLMIVGGGALLLVVLYLATRGSSAQNVVYAAPASQPADPNVLAAQVQQDQMKAQVALATINAAGTLDAINAQASGDVKRIDATYKGQGYLASIASNAAQSIAAMGYHQTMNTPLPVAPATTTPQPSTQTPYSGTVFSGGIPWHTGSGTTPVSTQPAGPTYPTKLFGFDLSNAQWKVQDQAQSCWWRKNVPIVGAFVC